MNRTAFGLFIGVAAVFGGIYLYKKYGKGKQKQRVGTVAGLVLGKKIGATTGALVAGPVGGIIGTIIGGATGAIIAESEFSSPALRLET